jgi:hypothetical protein
MLVEDLESRLLLDASTPNNLDPNPKTMTFNVIANPDYNLDGVVNGQDVNYIASRWLQKAPDGSVYNGLSIANIDANWLAHIDSIPLDEQTMNIVAANYVAQTQPVARGGDIPLRPIYPPPARL